MTQQESARQAVERIMRKADELGHDPRRVALALDHKPARTAETQAVVEVQRPFGLRLLARRFKRGSAG